MLAKSSWSVTFLKGPVYQWYIISQKGATWISNIVGLSVPANHKSLVPAISAKSLCFWSYSPKASIFSGSSPLVREIGWIVEVNLLNYSIYSLILAAAKGSVGIRSRPTGAISWANYIRIPLSPIISPSGVSRIGAKPPLKSKCHGALLFKSVSIFWYGIIFAAKAYLALQQTGHKLC